ncbi:DNA primase [Planctomycetales bacterium ZRK34]|nr:DNA primase [Planctomycetales bacterium ZRK34]
MNRDDAKKRVLESTDLVRLVSEHVVLKPRGREFIGVCPFHDDKNPSMYVVPHKQFYHCFSCGASGDAFSFVMGYHKMTFPEALKYLADRAGIELPRNTREQSSDEPTERQRIAAANQFAVEFFKRTLADERLGGPARRYITQRGISDEMVETFALGAAPDAWDALAQYVNRKQMDRQAFEWAGLIAPRKTGDGHFDKMRHRLMFPIFDAIGRPVAFGGRVLPEASTREEKSDAKYLNSPETALFNKSATLFGLHAAHKPISDSHTAVIVEGYTDVIAAHQAGARNVVATLGTALTAEHAAVLRRYADQVVLIFDADEAGQKAADRALQIFFNQPIDVKIAVLPDGCDPADLLARPDGLEQWQTAIVQAADAMTFQFRRVRQQFDAADTLAAKQRISEQYLRTLIDLGLDRIETARRGLVLARVAEMLRLDSASIDRLIRQLSGRRRATGPVHDEVEPDFDAPPSRPTAAQQAQRHLVGCLLTEPTLFHETVADGRELNESIGHDDFDHPPTAALYGAIYEWLIEHDQLTTADLRNLLHDENQVRYALQLQIEVSRLTDGSTAGLHELLTASATALAGRRAEQEYQQQKMLLRETKQEQPNNPGTTGTPPGTDSADDTETQRLALAIAHAQANPSARRVPRVSG